MKFRQDSGKLSVNHSALPTKWPLVRGLVVGDTGFEPVTSSVSGKRATAAPIAQRWRRDLNPRTRICSPLPRLSATPPCSSERTTGFEPATLTLAR